MHYQATQKLYPVQIHGVLQEKTITCISVRKCLNEFIEPHGIRHKPNIVYKFNAHKSQLNIREHNSPSSYIVLLLEHSVFVVINMSK